MPRPPDPDKESVPASISPGEVNFPQPKEKLDNFWAVLYLVCFAAMFASWFLVYLHIDTPSKKHPLGDSVYSVLTGSYHLLGVDTVVSIVVAVLWLAVMRNFSRPFIYLIVVAVPVVLISFSLFPLISSYQGRWEGRSLQDKLMRMFSIIPLILSGVWTYSIYRARFSVGRATEILEFGCKILSTFPGLFFTGLASIVLNVAWFWMWSGMFATVFLNGRSGVSGLTRRFIIDTGTWWLGIFFVLMYLWTQAIISGLQRCISASTVQQWYFYRTQTPSPSPSEVVWASFSHATTEMFGTTCLSTFLALAVRLPLLILPGRLAGMLSLCANSIIPTPLATLTNPLTLTYAGIHTKPLYAAAHDISSMQFIDANSATTTLTPSSMPGTFPSQRANPSLLSYRLSKLILHGTRWIITLGIGCVGWVRTSHSLRLSYPNDPTLGFKGSVYAYVVGFAAGAIGWAVFGAMEGVLGGIIDAVVVCWGTDELQMRRDEMGGRRRGEFCREAGELLGREGRW